MSAGEAPRGHEEHGGLGPYLAIVAAATVVGVAVAMYVLGYREEILAILTQLPT